MSGWVAASVVVRLQAVLVPWGSLTKSAKLRVRCLGKYS